MGWRVNGEQGQKLKRKEDGTTHAFFTGGHTNFNLVLRFSRQVGGYGHVSPRIWEITNKRLGEGGQINVRLSLLSADGK